MTELINHDGVLFEIVPAQDGEAFRRLTIEEVTAIAISSHDQLKVAREAFNTRKWSREMSDAWHTNIPDLQAAFTALLQQALKQIKER